MLTRSFILSITLAVTSSTAFAGMAAERWHNSEARQSFLESKAAELNIDISTAEGKAELKTVLDAQRVEIAAELGFDITTDEGKDAYREYRHEQRIARAAEQGFDITSVEGREAFREERHDQVSSLSEEDRAALREQLQGLNREERRDILSAYFGE